MPIFIPSIFFLMLAASSFILLCNRLRYRKPPRTTRIASYNAIRALLDPPSAATAMLLRCRALANARLLWAFEIHNSTFTSSSTDVHRDFRRKVMARLRSLEHPDKWKTLSEVIQGAVEFYLPDDPIPGNYAAFIQAIVLLAVLSAFFDYTGSFPEASDVRFVTEGINTIWMASKASPSHPVSSILTHINQHLHAWLPADPTNSSQDTPLEIILPAYETLWRLVAHAFPYVEDSPPQTLAFLRFFDNPTTLQFNRLGIAGTPGVQEIIQEVLRLHPPTKRIKRVLENVDVPGASLIWAHQAVSAAARFIYGPTSNHLVQADIEALHRSAVWGPSSHVFDPTRHRTLTQAQKESLMPFGIGPLKCIASSFAPRLAGMIVAGVAHRGDVKLIRGEELGGREGWKGWMISKES